MSSLLDDLNPGQSLAVTTIDGPVLILAGAGSGKTRALTYRTAYMMLDHNIPAHHILMVTFTNKAAGEMKSRVQELLHQFDPQPSSTNTQPFMGTFHSLCVRLLRIDGIHIGLNPNFTILDADDQKSIVTKILKNMNINTRKVSASAIHAVISHNKNELVDPETYTINAQGPYQETIAQVYHQYEKQLASSDCLDFDDLLTKAVALLQDNPEILAKYQRTYRYIMVDEYQDTNRVQYLLTKLLASSHHNLCVVGDMSQSIYKFRGADIRNILSFEKDYPETKVIRLEQNYRSTQNILDAANCVISKNRGHQVLNLYTNKKAGLPITLYEAQSEVDESHYIIKKIINADYLYCDVAILYRTNAQSRALEEALIRQSIPYRLVGGVRFYARKEIKDLLAYLRLIVNPLDIQALDRAQKIGKTRLKKLQTWLQKHLADSSSPPPDHSQDPPPPDPSLPPTLELLEAIILHTDYLDYIDDGTDTALSRIENIKELKTVASQYTAPAQFLEQVMLLEDPQLSSSQDNSNFNSVTLMTLHAAKGLEFKHIFIVGWEEGLFPHSRSLLNPDELEEERRLAYVGITRAMENLCLTYAISRTIYGTSSSSISSRFLADIPEKLIHYERSYSQPSYNSYDANKYFSANDDIYW
jgi:DNA helicase-2/ATP-dependent DNA helicase PcrA